MYSLVPVRVVNNCAFVYLLIHTIQQACARVLLFTPLYITM